MTVDDGERTVIGPLVGKPGRQWGVRVLLHAYTRREPVALVYVRGPRWWVGLRWRPWVRSIGYKRGSTWP
jgi:hypothetical protein